MRTIFWPVMLEACAMVGVTKDDADLGGGKALLRWLANLILDIRRCDLAPARGSAFVRAGTLGDTLSWRMKTSHAVRSLKKCKYVSDIPEDNPLQSGSSPTRRDVFGASWCPRVGEVGTPACRRQPLSTLQ